MALNKEILGQALYDFAGQFNETDIAPNQIEAQRLAFWKGIADEIIKHLKADAVVPGTGLIAPSGGGAVTGNAKIQ